MKVMQGDMGVTLVPNGYDVCDVDVLHCRDMGVMVMV